MSLQLRPILGCFKLRPIVVLNLRPLLVCFKLVPLVGQRVSKNIFKVHEKIVEHVHF